MSPPRGARLAGLVASLCLLAALATTFVPTAAGGFDCGTWPSAANLVTYDGSYEPLEGLDVSEAVAESPLDACDQKLSTRRVVSLALLAVSAVCGAYAGFLMWRRRRVATDDDVDDVDDVGDAR